MSALPLAPLRDAAPFHRVRQSFADFLDRYRSKLHHVFETRADADQLHLQRGLPPYVLNQVREVDPLTAWVPEEHGGRGGQLREVLSVLEATGYESLPLCLLIGINGGLFLQPVAKYGNDAIKRPIFDAFLRGKRMGGLMITEPDYGSDALSMQTSYRETAEGTYHIAGVKHWGGLTGWADYWLVTARPQATTGGLQRDVDFFVCDVNAPGQHIEVEEVYHNLGLWMLPYGRNRIDVEVPAAARLEPKTTGVRMLLDLLHRSRLQFPGMGMGFLRRLLDEGVAHARERFVGGRPLLDYDQVRGRLARIQASVTACAAMCLHTAEHAGTERDLADSALSANAVKSVVTDWMQEAAQSLLQLVGAKGYRMDHLAGRSVVDSRPFQIFEGSNDILYQQVTEAVLKGMRRVKESNLYRYLRQEPLTARAADALRDLLSFDVDVTLPQRKVVELGRALGRIVSMEMTIELGERGYRADLIASALEELRTEVRALLTTYREGGLSAVVEGTGEVADWLAYVKPAPAAVR
jgi:alkylation response protein AidB-like acyl-CoA dehydrogenase